MRLMIALPVALLFAAAQAATANAAESGLTLINVDDSVLEVDRSLNINQGGHGDTGSDVVAQTGDGQNLGA
ncbi:hypothetical protein [Saccharopolyspora taberi]|uniref:Secreted protein n=1 Tax=Saccharopolyspora taberi TaxID=60895 RepID=A0ABN3VAY6_9PSEU